MLLLRGMSHILDYVGSKIKTFFDDPTGNHSAGTLFITAIALLFIFLDFFGSLIV